jgi:hypothetical protein
MTPVTQTLQQMNNLIGKRVSIDYHTRIIMCNSAQMYVFYHIKSINQSTFVERHDNNYDNTKPTPKRKLYCISTTSWNAAQVTGRTIESLRQTIV